MPILVTYECPQCGARSDEQSMGDMPPGEWVQVIVEGRPEWFDQWSCVEAYAGEKNSAKSKP